MTYSVLLLGATGTIGVKIAANLSLQSSQLKRTAFLTPRADAGPAKEAKYATISLERIVGSLEDATSYKGFDVVISAVGDAVCAQQPKYIDAAFAAGVKHLYPAEYGADLTRDGTREESYFVNKIAARKHLAKRVKEDPSLGYTYVMTGLFSDFMIQFNTIFLSEDKKSANFTCFREARFSTTLSDDVAKVTGQPVAVRYESKEESYEKEQKEQGNDFLYKFTSARRSIGFGGSELVGTNKEDYPEIQAVIFEE
ncbi:hypothetical protein V1504DRAFT_436546 [Lipomyces starkeyi]